MFVRSAALILVPLLLLTTAAQASGVEPGSPLVVQPSRPRVAPAARVHAAQRQPAALPRVPRERGGARPAVAALQPGGAPGWRRARGTSWRRSSSWRRRLPQDIIYSHERVQLEAESLAAEQEIEALVDARAELLEELGRADPERSILEGELAPPWSPDGALDREALAGLVFAHTGRRAAEPARWSGC